MLGTGAVRNLGHRPWIGRALLLCAALTAFAGLVLLVKPSRGHYVSSSSAAVVASNVDCRAPLAAVFGRPGPVASEGAERSMACTDAEVRAYQAAGLTVIVAAALVLGGLRILAGVVTPTLPPVRLIV